MFAETFISVVFNVGLILLISGLAFQFALLINIDNDKINNAQLFGCASLSLNCLGLACFLAVLFI